MKSSVNKFIKEIQGSNGLKAEDSAASASILGSVSASPDKRLFATHEKERISQPQCGNMRRNMTWFVRCQGILSAKGVENMKTSVLQETLIFIL